MNKTGLLRGKKEIMSYLGFTEHVFKKWIGFKMPARLVDGTWYAHTDNLENFFRKITNYDRDRDKSDE